MAKAVAPTEMPGLPEGYNAWARSTKGRGGMFHAHVIGMTACGKRLDRHQSQPARHLGDMQYWGTCPRCLAKAKNDPR